MPQNIEPPIKTVYYYKRFGFYDGEPTLETAIPVECEIIAESEKQYKIRILSANSNLGVNKIMWVKKKNVKYNKNQPTYDYSDAYWNK